MRTLLVIGIGVGDPDWVTVQAINALNRVDVFFVLDKGPATADLIAARRAICERYVRDPRYRFVTVLDPPREVWAERGAGDYPDAVRDWRDERALVLEQVIEAELDKHGCGGFLVWGDPSLYDGTLRVIETLAARGAPALDYEVIPGVSSIHALAARHRIALNRVAQPVHITSGRRLAEGIPNTLGDIVVMLDPDLTCRSLEGEWDIYWGAYLGTDDEILVAGRLSEVIDDITRARARARDRKGWIMDSYLLRRPEPPG